MHKARNAWRNLYTMDGDCMGVLRRGFSTQTELLYHPSPWVEGNIRLGRNWMGCLVQYSSCQHWNKYFWTVKCQMTPVKLSRSAVFTGSEPLNRRNNISVFRVPGTPTDNAHSLAERAAVGTFFLRLAVVVSSDVLSYELRDVIASDRGAPNFLR